MSRHNRWPGQKRRKVTFEIGEGDLLDLHEAAADEDMPLAQFIRDTVMPVVDEILDRRRRERRLREIPVPSDRRTGRDRRGKPPVVTPTPTGH